jgi:hypothetical protein
MKSTLLLAIPPLTLGHWMIVLGFNVAGALINLHLWQRGRDRILAWVFNFPMAILSLLLIAVILTGGVK